MVQGERRDQSVKIIITFEDVDVEDARAWAEEMQAAPYLYVAETDTEIPVKSVEVQE